MAMSSLSLTIATQLPPGQDYSNECDKVKAICQATHTAEVIAAYQAMQDSEQATRGRVTGQRRNLQSRPKRQSVYTESWNVAKPK
jgi:hypothetical protein